MSLITFIEGVAKRQWEIVPRTLHPYVCLQSHRLPTLASKTNLCCSKTNTRINNS